MARRFVGGGVDLGGQKITGLADGVAADDAATVGQIPGADAWAGLPFQQVQIAHPAPNSGTISVLGCVFGGTGTATAAAISSTSRYASIPRADLLITTAAATACAGFRTTGAGLVRGAAAGAGGFRARLAGGPATGVTNATNRFFLGLRASTSAPTDVEPSTLVSMIGLGWNAADANVQIMHNDASGAAVKVDTGWAVPTTDRSVLYELKVSCSGGGSSYDYTATNIINGDTVSGTFTTDIPANTATLVPLIYHSAGGTSSVVGVTFVHWAATGFPYDA